MTLALPTVEDVRRAEQTLGAVVCETPLLGSPVIDAAVGAEVLIKAEALQRTGSFKFRGAYNRLSRLGPAERARGVVAYSSGNFGRALAAAGACLDIPVTVVVPIDAPATKIEAIREAGAEVVLSDHGPRNREEAASELAVRLASERELARLHPFDDPLIVAGQGTVALEMLAQAERRGRAIDLLLVPVGGGGLISGVALWAASACPATRVYAVEPEGYDGMCRSLAAGRRRRIGAGGATLCDALQAAMPGAVPFAVAKDRLAGGLTVADDAIKAAMVCAFRDLKIVLEPSGAIALAAAFSGGLETAGKCIGVVASGGNVAPEDFAALIAGA